MTYSERDLVGVFFKPITACLFTTSEKAGAGIHRPARSRHQRTQARACGRQRMGDRNGNAGWHSTPRHLRQHEDCRRPDSSRQRARGQRDGELLPVLMTGSVTWPRTGEKGQVRLVRIPNLPIACARIVEPGDRRDRHDSTFHGFDQRRLARRRQSACDSDYFFPARDDFDRNAEVSTSPASIAMVTISNFFSRTASASRSVAERWVFTACSTRHSG